MTDQEALNALRAWIPAKPEGLPDWMRSSRGDAAYRERSKPENAMWIITTQAARIKQLSICGKPIDFMPSTLFCGDDIMLDFDGKVPVCEECRQREQGEG